MRNPVLQSTSIQGHKIALYLRTASEEQGDSPNSLKAQEKALRNLVRSRNRRSQFGQIVGRFADSACSGMDCNRPGLKALLESVKHKEVDLILVTDVTRLSRSMKLLVDIMTTIGVNQCRLETCISHIPLGMVVDFSQGWGRK